MKKILLFAAIALWLGTSSNCFALSEKKDAGTEISATNIVVKGSTIYVSNAEGQVLEVFSLTGNKVVSVRINERATVIDLSVKKGCYILKVNNVVRKVSIR